MKQPEPDEIHYYMQVNHPDAEDRYIRLFDMEAYHQVCASLGPGSKVALIREDICRTVVDVTEGLPEWDSPL